MPKAHRINLRSDTREARAWRAAAAADHMDLSTWLRRLAWAEIDRRAHTDSPAIVETVNSSSQQKP